MAYDSELKHRLLGLTDITEVVTTDAAVAMARGARALLDVDVAIAVTGSAGPEPMEKPVGTVIVGVATPDDVRGAGAEVQRRPGALRTYGTAAALHLARLALSSVDGGRSSRPHLRGGALPEELRMTLAECLRPFDIPGKVVSPQNWHITLRFLGWIRRCRLRADACCPRRDRPRPPVRCEARRDGRLLPGRGAPL